MKNIETNYKINAKVSFGIVVIGKAKEINTNKITYRMKQNHRSNSKQRKH